MKIKTTILQKWLLVFLFSTAICSHAQQLAQQFTFNTTELHLSEDNGYDIVRLGDNGLLSGEAVAGKPALPLVYQKILLPKGAVATAVTMTIVQEQQLTGSFNIHPAQLPVYPNFEDPPPFVPQDAAIYGSNSPFPADPVINFETHAYRDYNYVGIEFIPFRYLPLAQQLYLFSQINITVQYSINGTTEEHKLRPYSAIDEVA